MHTITGLPRSGTTLLANILNQNPKFYASSTSPLGAVIQNISTAFSEAPEMSGMLIHDKGTPDRIKEATWAFVDEWYRGKDVVFDKGRIWTHMGLIHQDLFPKHKMIVVVRDPRDVFSSFEKQHRKEPMLRNSVLIPSDNIIGRAEQALAPEGMIGGPIVGIVDLITRKLDNVVFIRYEDFSEYPERAMKTIYEAIGEEYYEHDFENVVNVAEDVDETYHGKFPHSGSGKVKKVESEWEQYMSKELADDIIKRYPLFAKYFNYGN